ncbi:MAG: type I glyceraldehyde-3-phosphate dehydrogenase [Patescibacteria group bacterium]
MIKVAINGFGRIGRPALKIALTKSDLEVVAINDLTDVETLAHLLKYDSSYGIYPQEVTTTDNSIKIGDKEIKIVSEKEPDKLPWKDMGVDIVIESTGLFTKEEDASKHLEAGAKKVIISANAKSDSIPYLVMGVNQENYDPKNNDIVCNCSCTSNCLANIAKVLNDTLGIEKGLMSTVHSITNTQRILDLPHKSLREARSASQNIIPTETGAAKSIGKLVPELDGIMHGMAFRVPTPVVSVVDLVALVKKETTKEEVDKIYIEAARSDGLKGILGVSLEPLVSMDYKGSPYSAVVDLPLTLVVSGNLVKVVAWYDNEWGYANRLVELTEYIGKKL